MFRPLCGHFHVCWKYININHKLLHVWVQYVVFHSEDQGVDGRMGSERILGRLAGGGWGRCEVDSVGSGQVPVAGSCEYGNELSGSGVT
jgi:hypothetical protein